MKRMLGLAVLAGAAALTVLAVTAFGGTAHRAQPTGVTITPLAHATIAARVNTSSSGIKIKTHGPKDMLVTSIVVDPERLVRLAHAPRPGARERGRRHPVALPRRASPLPPRDGHGRTGFHRGRR